MNPNHLMQSIQINELLQAYIAFSPSLITLTLNNWLWHKAELWTGADTEKANFLKVAKDAIQTRSRQGSADDNPPVFHDAQRND